MKTAILSLSLALTMTSSFAAKKLNYPLTYKGKVVDTYFGEKIKEPYRWLENDTSKATAEWVKAQNKVTQEYMSTIPFRENLRKRLTQVMNYPRYGVPEKKSGYYYFFKNNGLQNQSVLFRQKDKQSKPEMILDPNTFSTDGTIALSHYALSADGRYLGYSIAKSGSDWNEIFVMDMQTRQLLSDHILWSKSSEISWQGNGFYYSAFDAPEAGKEYSVKNEFEKVFYHQIGQKQQQDQLVYEDKQHPLRECYASVSEDEKYLFISITETTTGNGILMKKLSDSAAQWIELAPGFKNDYSIIDHVDGKIYLLTNWEAPKNRLMEIDVNHPEQQNWKEILPETSDVLETVNIAKGKLIVKYMKDACNHLFTYDMQGNNKHEIQLATPGTIGGISTNKEEEEVFYTFTSYTYPPTIFSFSAGSGQANVYRTSDADFKSSDYISEQVFYTSKDGTKVPMSITYKKGMIRNGQNPLMLYGYGGFNVSLNPGFSTIRIPFLENGGIYVVANLRGGGEYGEAWHLAGTKMKKQNVFDDFIAAAEYLIKEKYTCSQKLAIDGGSNGGLLVGACMTQRPDLFAVAIPEVGVLDMLRYHRFTIGWSWASDYGTSEESKEMFQYLKGYSPLHNIKAGVKYPATMVMTGDHDDRVIPAHSFKFSATLQAANQTERPTLIRIDSKAGHGAGKPIGKVIEAQADMWSFVMYNLGMQPTF